MLCSNPMLELADELDQDEDNLDEDNQSDPETHPDDSGESPDLGLESSTNNNTNSSDLEALADDSSEQLSEEWNEQIPDDLPVDAQWDDIYPGPTKIANTASDDTTDFENYHSVTESLHDHLHWQLNLTVMSDIDRSIADALIDAIDESGFLSLSVEDVWEGLSPPGDRPEDSNKEDEQTENENLVDLDEVIAVLHRIQQFDPAGVGAADLSDCLLIQLKQLSADTSNLEVAKSLAAQYLPQVARRENSFLCRKLNIDEHTLKTSIQLIQTLSPRPGDHVHTDDTRYIIPDARVQRKDGRWLVTLNNEVTPKLCINKQYASYVKRGDNSPDNQFLRENLQEARWFLRSLESRNETFLRVTLCIVEMQKEFLERGPEGMKPMVLANIADQLGLHESTISRVTTQKYLDTPQGICELKYFFSSHVNTDDGGECSSTAIRAMIKKIVLAEPAEKPFSDKKLSTLLQERGIQVARRTVAKYRESLGIRSSNDRKRLKSSA